MSYITNIGVHVTDYISSCTNVRTLVQLEM